MGGRSRKSSGGSSAPKATESSTVGMYNNLLGGQLNTISNTIAPLIQGGLEMFGANPGMQNFSDKTGKKFEFNEPEWLTEFSESARSWAPPQQLPGGQNQAQGETPFYLRGVSDGQRARYQNWLAHQNKFGG